MSIENMKAEADSLFQIYKRLKRRRNFELMQAGNRQDLANKVLRDEADDYFLLFLCLRLLVMSDLRGFQERKQRLLERAA